MDSEEYSIQPGDSHQVISFKLEKIKEYVQPYTARDDLGGIEDASMDISHANLNSLLGKLGINVTCQAGPGSARFVQKFLPETMVEPEETDLKILVVMSTLYSETVLSKPVYTVCTTKLKKRVGML